MSMGQLLASGAAAVFNPGMFLMVCVAIILGTIFGALPGVSATMAVALGLTFTYTMEPIPAIVFLVAIYCSSITGGSITAILFKIPGVPSSAPTTFDGYPMAQRGEAGKALGVALLASAIGGLFSAIAMFLLSQPLTKAALQFGPSDLFAVTFMGLSILTCLDSDHILTCIISGLLGLLMACVGQDKMYAVQRLTFGSRNLLAGIDMIPVLIGLFAVTEVFKQTDPKKKRLSETCDNQPFIAAAPLVLVFCADYKRWYDLFASLELGETLRRPGEGDMMLAMVDAVIAAHASVVAADALGYGSCYIGDIIERCEQQREILGLPAYVMPVCMAVYGVPTEFQRERQKPARFDVRDIVFENEYQPRGAAEMRRMLEARQDKHGAELEQWITARCKRKWNCEFSEEMTRSAAKMIEMWREGK